MILALTESTLNKFLLTLSHTANELLQILLWSVFNAKQILAATESTRIKIQPFFRKLRRINLYLWCNQPTNISSEPGISEHFHLVVNNIQATSMCRYSHCHLVVVARHLWVLCKALSAIFSSSPATSELSSLVYKTSHFQLLDIPELLTKSSQPFSALSQPSQSLFASLSTESVCIDLSMKNSENADIDWVCTEMISALTS